MSRFEGSVSSFSRLSWPQTAVIPQPLIERVLAGAEHAVAHQFAQRKSRLKGAERRFPQRAPCFAYLVLSVDLSTIKFGEERGKTGHGGTQALLMLQLMEDIVNSPSLSKVKELSESGSNRA